MPSKYFDGHRTLHLSNVPQKLLEEIRTMSEADFLDKAEENGWDANNEYSNDNTFVKEIYKRLHAFSEVTPDNEVYKVAANILTRDLSKSKFADAHKADLVNHTTGKNNYMFYSNRTERGVQLRQIFDENVTSDEDGMYRDSQDEKDITAFDYAYDPAAALNSWAAGKMAFLDECGKEIWTSPEERKLLSELYDACAANGTPDEELANMLTRFNTRKGQMTEKDVVDVKKSCIQDFRNRLVQKSTKADLTPSQDAALANADSYLENTIPALYAEVHSHTAEGKRENWIKTAFNNLEYVHGAFDTLNAIYTVAQDAPADSALGKLLKAFETGKPEGYDAKTMSDQPALVTSMLLQDAKKVLGKAENTQQVQKALDTIAKYEEAVKKARAKEEKDLPFTRIYNAVTAKDQEAIRSLANTMADTKNSDGAGETKEFKDMLKSMRDFANSPLGGPLGSINGMRLSNCIKNMDAAIEQFITSEKKAMGEKVIQNANIGLAASAMNTVNPFRAAEHKSEIAQNLYQNLSNTRKEWYDRKDTAEYTKFLDSLKTFQEVRPGDEGYQKASDDLKKYAMEYINKKKGGLTVDAHQTGGDARRKMAILSVALVDLGAAQQMVDEANKVRASKKLKVIDLKELALKEGFGELIKDKIDKKNALRVPDNKVKEAPEFKGPSIS